MKKLLLLVTLITGFIAFSLPAQATSLVMGLNYEFSGANEPAGSTDPWLKATFDDGGTPGVVTLKLEGVGLVANEFVTEWDFNFNPDLALDSLGITTSYSDVSIDKGTDNFKADGDGYFDIQFSFVQAPPANRFGAGSVAMFEFTMDGLTVNDFNFVSVDGPVGKTGFLTAAHVQGIGPNDDLSGWIAPNSHETVIPEPSTVFLLGLGLLGILGFGRKLKK